MILDHSIIRIHTNKTFEECAVFLHFIDAGVCGTFLYIGYLCGFWSTLFYSCKYCLILLLVVVIDVSGSMKMIK